MLTGSQNMPSFPDSTLPQDTKADIIAYLQEVDSASSNNEGGFTLGSIGPVSEGLFAWVFGLGTLIAIATWVAARTTKAKKS
jgi:ubiquinol-cytochrome c reductase cytochrome c subunit